MYGLHANNMEKVNSWALAQRIKKFLKIYIVIMFVTLLLPKRVLRIEFNKTNNSPIGSSGEAVLLHRLNENSGKVIYPDRDAELKGTPFFRFRKLLVHDNEKLDEFEILISQMSAIEMKMVMNNYLGAES